MNEHLYRSRDDRMIAGVAGGLAEIWDADPSLIRIVWALLIFLTGGIALLVYIVMAIVVPEEDIVHATPETPAPGATEGTETDTAAAAAAAAAPPVDRREARRAARAARRAARRDRGPSSAGIVIGGLLIVIGGVFFVRQFLPQFTFDWFWPLILVGLGVVLLVAGFTRDGRSGQGPSS
jgi:phage shock protein C